MRHIITILVFFSISVPAFGQGQDIDDWKQELETTKNDTLRMALLDSLSVFYLETDPDSAFYYAEKESELCRKLGCRLNEALAMGKAGYALVNMGNYPRALQILFSGLQIAEDPQSEKNIPFKKYWNLDGHNLPESTPGNYRLQIQGWLHFNLGVAYENGGNSEKELYHYFRALHLGEQTGNLQLVGIPCMNLGRSFLKMKKRDSALIYERKAYQITVESNFKDYIGSILLNLGRIYLAMGNKEQALVFIRQAILASREQKYFRGVIAGNLLLSDISAQGNRVDSGFYFSKIALQLALQLNSPDLLLRCYNAMAALYSLKDNSDSTVKYQNLIIKIKDSLFNSKQAQQFQNIDFEAEQRQKEIETAKRDFRNRLRLTATVGISFTFLVVAVLLWRNNRNKQKAYALLERQKKETENAYEQLKSTQAQLIQSEKMASLGELTAGIAHEIQNPLNFVNNFSDVNAELIDEAEQQIDKGNVSEARTILNDVKENEQKINHHGKRADAIVKGMLQHSRTSSGQKKPTDINALADEYLRLSYHGLRAKDKSFNAKVETNFDNSIGKINIVPQDIGRVILNLINNAFFAVSEKQRQSLNSYEPSVTLTTAKQNGKVEIKVKDNGNGIPQNIVDKIFQPFFTTKPTGQGTGLGLSLAYDIIKAHRGEIKVDTKENEGSQFIIQLPVG